MPGYTLQQLQAMRGEGKTLDQLNQMRSKPTDTRTLSEKLWGGLASLPQKYASFLPGEKVGGYLGQKLGDTLGLKRREDAPQDITKGQAIGDIVEAGAFFAPTGRIASGIYKGLASTGLKTGISAISKIGAGAVTGEAFDVAMNLQEGKTGVGAFKPGIGTAIGAGLPAIGVAKNVAFRFAERQAPRIINSLIKPLAKDFSYGKNPGRAVAEAKIIANDFDELATKINDVRQTTGREIGALGRKLSTKPIVNIQDSLSPLDDAMNLAASENNASLLQRLSEVKRAVTTVLEPAVDDEGKIIIKEVGKRKLENLTFSEARDVLSRIGDMTKFTGNPSDDKLVNSALKRVYGLIKGDTLAVAKETSPELFQEFKKLTERYADLTSAEVATKYRDKIVERSNLVSLSPQLAGIASGALALIASGGAAAPAVLAGLTGAVVDKLASTPGFKTRLAALLSKRSPKEINLIFQKAPALRNFFTIKGKSVLPGDMLLETKVGQKVEAGVKDYIKNPKIGLTIKDVSKTPEAVAGLMDKQDISLLEKYLNKSHTIAEMEKAERILKDIGILNLKPDVLDSFIKDIVDLAKKRLAPKRIPIKIEE